MHKQIAVLAIRLLALFLVLSAITIHCTQVCLWVTSSQWKAVALARVFDVDWLNQIDLVFQQLLNAIPLSITLWVAALILWFFASLSGEAS